MPGHKDFYIIILSFSPRWCLGLIHLLLRRLIQVISHNDISLWRYRAYRRRHSYWKSRNDRASPLPLWHARKIYVKSLAPTFRCRVIHFDTLAGQQLFRAPSFRGAVAFGGFAEVNRLRAYFGPAAKHYWIIFMPPYLFSAALQMLYASRADIRDFHELAIYAISFQSFTMPPAIYDGFSAFAEMIDTDEWWISFLKRDIFDFSQAFFIPPPRFRENGIALIDFV